MGEQAAPIVEGVQKEAAHSAVEVTLAWFASFGTGLGPGAEGSAQGVEIDLRQLRHHGLEVLTHSTTPKNAGSV
jgi:hypothetical protein